MWKKKKNIVKVNVYVCFCICFMNVIFYESFFMIKSQKIKKKLIFWFAYSQELWTYM